MNILFFIPALLIFIYCVYILVKDDYVFIRKNISTEQMIDIVFIDLWIGLFFSRLFHVLLHPISEQNIFLSFFSLKANDYSLLGLVLGSTLGLYLIGKYKKLPTERFFDIFTMSFSVALPVGLLIHMITLRDYFLLINFISALLYGIFAYFLIKRIQLKYVIFMIFFLLLTFANLMAVQFLNHLSFINFENIFVVVVFILVLVLLVKQKMTKSFFVKKYKA